MNTQMNNKICLVTGATSGIGQATAQALADLGTTVIVVGRSPQKCAATVEHIRSETGNARVEWLVANLASQTQIRALADSFKQKYARLDVLINNAGVINLKREVSEDGIEMTFAVNHLGHFLLTHLLLEVLRASAPARIVNLSSGAHATAKLDFDDLEAKRRYSTFHVYGQSKLANVLFTRELARRLAGTRVTANCANPGPIRSGLGTNNGWLGKVGMGLFGLFAPGPEKGAQTSIYLATSPEVEGVTGKYFVNKREVRPAPAALDDAAAQQLWEISERYTQINGVNRAGGVTPQYGSSQFSATGL